MAILNKKNTRQDPLPPSLPPSLPPHLLIGLDRISTPTPKPIRGTAGDLLHAKAPRSIAGHDEGGFNLRGRRKSPAGLGRKRRREGGRERG